MKTILLLLSLLVTTAQAATVRLYFIDPLTNNKDTNAFYITPIGTNVLSSGGVVGRGVTTRYVPATNGYATNTLAVGHYSVTNRSLGSGVVIRVPETSSLYDYTNLLISGYNIFVTVTNGASGSSLAAGTNIVTVTNGSLVTVHGTANVTQSSLAAGSYQIAERALTGFLRFSSTNTAFLDDAAVATNAITVVSNASGYASFTLPSKTSLGVQIGGTYYRKSYGVYTNGALGAVFWVDPTIDEDNGSLEITNAAHSVLDIDILAVAFTANNPQWFTTSSEVLDSTGTSFSPALFPSAVVTRYVPNYATFNGKHVGDGSGLMNLPSPPGVITNNWQAGAPAIFFTNTVNVGKMSIKEGDIRFNYASPYTNAFVINSNYMYFGAGDSTLFSAYQLRWGLNSESYCDLGSWGSFLMRSRYIGMEVPADFSTIRLTDDHRIDGLVKLAGQSLSGLVFPTNNFSGMLAFQSPVTNGVGTYVPGYAGIRSKNASGVEAQNINGEPMSHCELWLYTLIPPQLSNSLGGFRSVGDTNWFLIGHTNGVNIKTNAYVLGSVYATNGFASYSTVTAAAITATGWTNSWSTNNATVYVERGASVAVTLKNRANTTLNTFTAGTTPLTISLQPGWGFSASGNLSGNAVPF